MRFFHLLFLFLLIALIATLEFLALEHFLFWKYWWMDVLLHTLGGVFIGGVSLFLSQYGLVPFLTGRPYLTVLPLAAIVVFAWEIFEKAIGAFEETNYWVDTTADISLGFGMALLTVTLLWRRIHPKT